MLVWLHDAQLLQAALHRTENVGGVSSDHAARLGHDRQNARTLEWA